MNWRHPPARRARGRMHSTPVEVRPRGNALGVVNGTSKQARAHCPRTAPWGRGIHHVARCLSGYWSETPFVPVVARGFCQRP